MPPNAVRLLRDLGEAPGRRQRDARGLRRVVQQTPQPVEAGLEGVELPLLLQRRAVQLLDA